MDKEMRDMFNAVIEEIGNSEERINGRLDSIENGMGQIRSEVNACKLERESVSLLLKKIDELERRISQIETRTA